MRRPRLQRDLLQPAAVGIDHEHVPVRAVSAGGRARAGERERRAEGKHDDQESAAHQRSGCQSGSAPSVSR